MKMHEHINQEGADRNVAPSPESTALRHRPVRKFPLTLRGLRSKRTGTSFTKESSSVLPRVRGVEKNVGNGYSGR